MNKMKHKNKALIAVCLFALVCFDSSLYGAAEPNEQDIQLAKEKMQRLREVYTEVQQAEMELQRLTEEAEREEPLLRPTVEALKKMKAFYEALDHQRFHKYLNDSKDRKVAYRLYEHCKATFSGNKSLELLNDPNEERLVKKPLIHICRKELRKDPLTGFDPNDPNDERVWQSIKQILYFQQSPEGYLQQRREYYIKGKGVPEWLPDYAGDMAFADRMINTYETGILLLTPQDVRDAEKRVNNLYVKIGKIYFRWGEMRHLLAGENNPDNEAVIHAVQEHMQIWPTVRRK
jgi:hypothetical protein